MPLTEASLEFFPSYLHQPLNSLNGENLLSQQRFTLLIDNITAHGVSDDQPWEDAATNVPDHIEATLQMTSEAWSTNQLDMMSNPTRRKLEGILTYWAAIQSQSEALPTANGRAARITVRINALGHEAINERKSLEAARVKRRIESHTSTTPYDGTFAGRDDFLSRAKGVFLMRNLAFMLTDKATVGKPFTTPSPTENNWGIAFLANECRNGNFHTVTQDALTAEPDSIKFIDIWRQVTFTQAVAGKGQEREKRQHQEKLLTAYKITKIGADESGNAFSARLDQKAEVIRGLGGEIDPIMRLETLIQGVENNEEFSIATQHLIVTASSITYDQAVEVVHSAGIAAKSKKEEEYTEKLKIQEIRTGWSLNNKRGNGENNGQGDQGDSNKRARSQQDVQKICDQFKYRISKWDISIKKAKQILALPEAERKEIETKILALPDPTVGYYQIIDETWTKALGTKSTTGSGGGGGGPQRSKMMGKNRNY